MQRATAGATVGGMLIPTAEVAMRAAGLRPGSRSVGSAAGPGLTTRRLRPLAASSASMEIWSRQKGMWAGSAGGGATVVR